MSDGNDYRVVKMQPIDGNIWEAAEAQSARAGNRGCTDSWVVRDEPCGRIVSSDEIRRDRLVGVGGIPSRGVVEFYVGSRVKPDPH